jgi:hypothetical protein
MTSRSDDELVSSVLDGEASAAERATVTSDPSLRERLTEFAAIQRVVRTVDVSDDLADRLRVAALAAVEVREPRPPEVPITPVRSMAAHRTGRDRHRRTAGALAAAAVVVLGLLGVGALRSSEDHPTLATAGSTARTEAATPEEPQAFPAADASTTVRDLGAAADLAALAAAWRTGAAKVSAIVPSVVNGPAAAGASSASPPASGAGPDRCGPAVAFGSLAGRPVVLLGEPSRIRVLDAERCVEVGSFTP